MALSKMAYKALESIVGEEYISDDPAVCQAYTRGGWGKGIYDMGSRSPACVVLPRNTEEVQAIIKTANRYHFPFIPMGSFYIGYCAPTRPDTMMIDSKRMAKLEIDDKNMYAVIEPNVNYGQLQVEAMKLGLNILIPFGGSQCSVLANHLTFAAGGGSYRQSGGNRRILGVEWVLPDGEILKLGSTAIKDDAFFWGEGPGPDLRGLLRGKTGHMGGLGCVTKMGVKLFSIPPCEPERTGISPNTSYSLPANRFRWYVMLYPDPEKAIDAMYEIGAAEIGISLMKVPPLWRPLRKATSKHEFWELWNDEISAKVRESHTNIVRVTLVGFASQKQLEYEERVLKDIAEETGGQLKQTYQSGASDLFQMSYANIAWRPTGAFLSEKLNMDSIDHAYKVLKAGDPQKRAQIPHFLIEDGEEIGDIWVWDFGHMAACEQTVYFDATVENFSKIVDYEIECNKKDLSIRVSPMHVGWNHYLLGPMMGNYHLIMEKVQAAFDPNKVSNPPRFYISPEEREEDPTFPGPSRW
jgi:glycolate oxidase